LTDKPVGILFWSGPDISQCTIFGLPTNILMSAKQVLVKVPRKYVENLGLLCAGFSGK